MWYYHIQPSELAALDTEEIEALRLNIPRLKALDSLQFVANICAVFSKDLETYVNKICEDAEIGKFQVIMPGKQFIPMGHQEQ